jgi:hypothetical protein
MNDDEELIADEFEETLKREANISVDDLQKIVIEKKFNLITKENFEGIFSFLHFYGYHDFNNYIDEFIKYTDVNNLSFDISFSKNIFKLDKIFTISCVGCQEKCNTVKKAIDRNHVYCVERFGKNEFREIWQKYGLINVCLSMCNFLLAKSYLHFYEIIDYISFDGRDDDVIEYLVEIFPLKRLFKLLIRNGRIEMAKLFIEIHIESECPIIETIIEFNSLDLFKFFHDKKTENFTGPEKLKISSSLLDFITPDEKNVPILKFLFFDCNLSKRRESIMFRLQDMFLDAIGRCWSNENLQIFIDAHLNMDSFHWLSTKHYPTFYAIHSPRIMQFLIDNGADLGSRVEKYNRPIMEVLEHEQKIAKVYKREFRYEKTYELLKEHLK